MLISPSRRVREVATRLLRALAALRVSGWDNSAADCLPRYTLRVSVKNPQGRGGQMRATRPTVARNDVSDAQCDEPLHSRLRLRGPAFPNLWWAPPDGVSARALVSPP